MQQAAQTALNARQTAIAAQTDSSATRQAAEADARHRYSALRKGARDVFKSEAERTALALNGNVPEDTQSFLALAKETYAAAQTAPYAARLTANGYPAAYITAGLAAVTAFQNADVAQNLAIGVANKALTDRNTAYASLSDWLKRVMHVAEDELHARPDLLKKLKP